MLKNLDPLLTPELLSALAAMGHGDEVAVVDANFPGHRLARSTVHGRAIYLPGSSLSQAIRAILSVLPLDGFVEHPVQRMAMDDEPEILPEVQLDAQDEIERTGHHGAMAPLDRFAFYVAAESSFAIVITGECRPWGNVLLKKGAVVWSPGEGDACAGFDLVKSQG